MLNCSNKYYGNATLIVDPEYQITDIQVWKSIDVITTDQSKERKANAYIDLQDYLQEILILIQGEGRIWIQFMDR